MANALTEFGRKSTGYKVAVFVAIAVVFGGLYYQFAFKKARAKRNEARSDNAAALAQSATLDKQKKEHDKNLADYKTLEKTIQENQKALPTDSELPAFFDTLGRKVAEAGVQVKRWDYGKEVPTDNFIKVPLEVEVTGTFYQMKRFFASLIQRDPVPVVRPDGTTQVEERERIVTIENLQLLDAKGKNNELVMTAKFTASTFRQEQATAPEDPSKAKPGAPGAGAGSGSGAGSAKPPAATPAGAKAATEDAMKKDETRTDDKLKGGVP